MSGIKNLRKRPWRIGAGFCQAGRPVPRRSIYQDGAYDCQYAAKRPCQNRSASPGHRRANAKCNSRERAGDLRGWLEYWRVVSLRDAQDKQFVSSFFIEVFVKFETKLTGVDANRAVFEGTVTRGFVKQRAADLLFRQFVGMPMNGPFRDMLQQLTQASTLLKGRAGHNSLDELPPLVSKNIVCCFGTCS